LKLRIFARAGALVLAVVVLALFQVTTSYAARWNKADENSAFVPSCANESSFSPTSVYTKITVDENGSFAGFEIHMSNSNGDCSALLYSSNSSKKQS